MNAIHCFTNEDMFAVVLWHINEYVIEFLERLIVSIAAEYDRH